MWMRLLIPLAVTSLIYTVTGAPPTSTPPSSVIKTTKITPSYWRATFSDPPFNIQGNAFFGDFYALVDEITSDPNVKVVVFDSSSEYFFSAHVDLVNPLDPDFITRLSKAPVITVAALRGYAYNAGAEIAAALDFRFGSKEKAVLHNVNPGGDPDTIDAETAALYGWINRSIPNAQLEKFVNTFARRVAENLINERTGFPTTDQQPEIFNAFAKADAPAIAAAGMQTNLNFEENFGQEELKFVGSGPRNA
ncbi:ClpP/crotonase [Trichoderma chlorosporum]